MATPGEVYDCLVANVSWTVLLSVCVYVGHIVSPKTDEPIEVLLEMWIPDGPGMLMSYFQQIK